MRYLIPLLVLSLTACNRGDDESGADSAPDDACGDVDGEGGDTGNVPNVLGNYTSDVGKNLFMESCGLDGFKSGSDLAFDGAMEIKGRVPDTIYAQWDDPDINDTKFWGVVAPGGAVSFAGQYDDSRHGTIHVAMGGMAYYDEYRQRTYIEGFAWYGISTDDDPTTIECTARGEWTASKSGA
ncbi:MAG: hypothetical protein GY913_16780 [Proteobacteria bacterium]|nr:hypothetical protein [Pseudomonadota bacterium]MCP4918559.1 hypothetical protein [Pseudomonadota bacterium]